MLRIDLDGAPLVASRAAEAAIQIGDRRRERQPVQGAPYRMVKRRCPQDIDGLD
jgi:hypothetical protein